MCVAVFSIARPPKLSPASEPRRRFFSTARTSSSFATNRSTAATCGGYQRRRRIDPAPLPPLLVRILPPSPHLPHICKMPAHKRSNSSDGAPASDGSPSPPPPGQKLEPKRDEEENDGGVSGERAKEEIPAEEQQQLETTELHPKGGGDSDGDAGSPSSPSDGGNDEFIVVKLADIRKEVQCPICLGIIRKTRTVMECLHRFCRECIDKSMRLGNNECPACRTHCASRRSLRDDPNYDALIAVLYPDIDSYEEEELALYEEDKNRNKKIQASIEDTFRRQSEALGRKRTTAKATAAVFMRRSQANYRSSNTYLRRKGRNGSRGTTLAGSDDDEEEDMNDHDGGQDSSSADERSMEPRPKRSKRWTMPRASPARASVNMDAGSEDNDDLDANRETQEASPLQIGSREIPAWGKGGMRSQTRHGNTSGSNGRFIKAMRATKMVEFLRALDENEDKFDVHLTLLPLDEKAAPRLERPYLCCRPTLTVRHICQFIALQALTKAEDVEIFVREPQSGTLGTKTSTTDDKAVPASPEFRILGGQESLAGLYSSSTSVHKGNLALAYHIKLRNNPRE